MDARDGRSVAAKAQVCDLAFAGRCRFRTCGLYRVNPKRHIPRYPPISVSAAQTRQAGHRWMPVPVEGRVDSGIFLGQLGTLLRS